METTQPGVVTPISATFVGMKSGEIVRVPVVSVPMSTVVPVGTRLGKVVTSVASLSQMSAGWAVSMLNEDDMLDAGEARPACEIVQADASVIVAGYIGLDVGAGPL